MQILRHYHTEINPKDILRNFTLVIFIDLMSSIMQQSLKKILRAHPKIKDCVSFEQNQTEITHLAQD